MLQEWTTAFLFTLILYFVATVSNRLVSQDEKKTRNYDLLHQALTNIKLVLNVSYSLFSCRYSS